jgi:hypothetical protein
MKRPYCAKLDRSEMDHVEPNYGLHHQIIMWDLHSSELLHSVQCNPYRHFWTTDRYHLQGSRNPKEQSMNEVNWHNLLFWDFVCQTAIEKIKINYKAEE